MDEEFTWAQQRQLDAVPWWSGRGGRHVHIECCSLPGDMGSPLLSYSLGHELHNHLPHGRPGPRPYLGEDGEKSLRDHKNKVVFCFFEALWCLWSGSYFRHEQNIYTRKIGAMHYVREVRSGVTVNWVSVPSSPSSLSALYPPGCRSSPIIRSGSRMSLSTTVTRRPSRARTVAMAAPSTPAPTMTTSGSSVWIHWLAVVLFCCTSF